MRVFGFFVLCLTLLSSSLGADNFFTSVTELKKMMADSKMPLCGFYETVRKGNKVEPRPMCLTGDMTVPFLGKMIVANAKEPLAAGDSGSLAYVVVDGRRYNIGATAYSWPFERSNYSVLITPGEEMIAEYEAARADMETISLVQSYSNANVSPVALGDSPFPLEFLTTLSHKHPIPDDILRKLQNQKITMATSGTARDVDGALMVLSQGMPLLAEIASWTDEKGKETIVGATGTTTHVSPEKKVYAFGHPLLGFQKVAYPFRTCNVVKTVDSYFSSFKVTGDQCSDVLGFIKHDGSRGIAGDFGGLDRLKSLPKVYLEIRKEQIFQHFYKIRVVEIPQVTPYLIGEFLNLLIKSSGTPVPGLVESFTSVTASARLKGGHSPLTLKKEFYSKSSAQDALANFLLELYLPLIESPYNLQIEDIKISIDISSEPRQVLTLAKLDFPTVLDFGENPRLSMVLVNKNNSKTLRLDKDLQIDWEKIKKNKVQIDLSASSSSDGSNKPTVLSPFFGPTLGNTLQIFGASWYNMALDDEERIQQSPKQSLNAKEFLEHLERSLQRQSKQQIFAKLFFTKKVDENLLEPKKENDSKKTPPQKHWQKDGSLDKHTLVIDQPAKVISMEFPMPELPEGYIVDSSFPVTTVSFKISGTPSVLNISTPVAVGVKSEGMKEKILILLLVGFSAMVVLSIIVFQNYNWGAKLKSLSRVDVTKTP